jgi:hypothetical protein
LADGSIGDWFGGFLYSSGQQANEAVQDQLSALSFTRFVSTILPSICYHISENLLLLFSYALCFTAYSALQFGSDFWSRACNQPFSLYIKCFTVDPWLHW